jgi:hypothetical protein
MGNELIRTTRESTGPGYDDAQRILERNPKAAAVFVFTIVDDGSEWTVDAGSTGNPVSTAVLEQFRLMLHSTVDAVIDSSRYVAAPGEA